MKRLSLQALAFLGVAALALTACGTTDNADVDTTAAGDVVADTTTGDTTPADTTPVDTVVPVPCDGKCPEALCDTATNTCKVPCDGKCLADESCNAENKCVKQMCKDPTFGTNLQKMSKIEIGVADDGCDLNDDGLADNALGKILKQLNFLSKANDTLIEQIATGTLVLIFEPSAYKTDGTPFDMNLLLGDGDAAAGTCDYTTGACKYTVKKASYDLLAQVTGFCPALVNFGGATIKDLKLKAGSKEQKFALSFPISGIPLSLTISQAQVEGTVTTAEKWVDTKSGKVCGVIAKEDLEKAVDAVPDETILALGIGDKATVKALLQTIIQPDIDLDGDGVKDAVSIALKFESVEATVTGFTPETTTP